MKTIFLSIVIPTYNSQKTILRLLKSISNSRFDNFKNIEVIIVDDASKDKTIQQIEKINKTINFSLLTFNLTHKGPAYARNYGVSKAKGQYILFLDGDVVLKKDTLQNAYNFFKHKKGRAFTGVWDKRQKTKKFFPQFKALRDYAYWFAERELGSRYYLFSTRIAGIEKKLFQALGGFDTSFKKPTVEDIDLTYKIERYTKISFEPDMMVEHEFEDFLPLAKKYFARSRDWVKLYFKRLRFDPVATSRREANKSIVVGFFGLFLALFFIFNSVYILYISLIFFFIFLGMEFNFLTYLYFEKGLSFTLLAVPTSIILYLIIDLGSAIGLVEYFIKKGNSGLPKKRNSGL